MTTQNISVLPTPVVDALDLARRWGGAAPPRVPPQNAGIETTDKKPRAPVPCGRPAELPGENVVHRDHGNIRARG